MKRIFAGVLALALGAPLAGAQGLDSPWPEDWLAPSRADRDRWETPRVGPRQKQRMDRHRVFMSGRVIEPYDDMVNPLEPIDRVIAAGAALYAEQCQSCHGADGYGDGDAALALDPSPALLAFMVRMPRAMDSYLMWTISDGGTSFGTEMPAYRRLLSETEIWQIITFMRAGFGPGED